MITNLNGHSNHVSQIGSDSCLDQHEPEWCPGYQGNNKNLSTKPIYTYDLINWSFQVTRGMDYLSSKKVCF